MPRSRNLTLLDVIQVVGAETINDEETVATVVHLLQSGQVRLGTEALTAMMDVLASANTAA